MMDTIRKTEELLFKKFSRGLDIQEVPLVFILASPRAGSTAIYQMLINTFNFFYFSNFINDFFPECPVIGAALNSMINTRREVTKVHTVKHEVKVAPQRLLSYLETGSVVSTLLKPKVGRLYRKKKNILF